MSSDYSPEKRDRENISIVVLGLLPDGVCCNPLRKGRSVNGGFDPVKGRDH